MQSPRRMKRKHAKMHQTASKLVQRKVRDCSIALIRSRRTLTSQLVVQGRKNI